MRVDCAPVRIETWEELVAYMDGSAGSVGRIMAPLLGVPEAHHADFGRLGLAFQLANFIRDVREDRRLDRIYLPGEDRDRFGVAEADLDRPGGHARAARAGRPRGRAAPAGCSRAAEPAVAAAPASVRPGIRLACALYLRHARPRRGARLRRARPPPAACRAWQLPLRRAGGAAR